MSVALPLEDRLAIHDLLNLYGHVIDERQFSRFGELFAEDAVFDLSGFDGSRFEGLEAISQMMHDSENHPLAHHATNILVMEEGGEVRALSKGIGVGNGGRVGSVTYRDVLVRTEDGWRIRERSCELRQADRIPPLS